MRKYHNHKPERYGRKWDSAHELQRYEELLILQKAGEISELETQVKFQLIPNQYAESTEIYKRGPRKGQCKPGKLLEKECSYYADFRYVDANGTVHIEDAKGMKLPEYIIKRKMMLYLLGITVEEV